MTKKSKSIADIDAPTYPEEPPACIRMCKEQAKKYSIGDKVRITVSGEVQAIRKSYGDPKENRYEVELKNSKVADESEESERTDNPVDNRKV